MKTPLPFRHLSIRVPWHDAGWDGTVCRRPLNNNACLCLRGISESREDAWEHERAGQHMADMGDEVPPCLRERAGFMSDRPFHLNVSHKLGHDEDYAHILPTPLAMPAYSAPGVPFRWLMREGAAANEERLGIGYDPEREPMERWKEKGTWVLDADNQRACLDSFWSAIKPGRSLVFFYAKAIPGVEDDRRVLIGAAHISELKPLREYIKGDPEGTAAWVWERPVVHTLRPGFADGFLMPYHALLERVAAGEPLHLPDFVAFAPDEHRGDFSYATEQVGGDAALGALEEMRRCLARCAEVVPGPWERVQSWINDRIIEVRRQRGAYPGLGAALTAFGMPLGEVVAGTMTEELRDEDDPWQRVERGFADSKSLPAALRPQITVALQSKWKHLPAPRRAYLRLLSRLALAAEQAAMLWQADDRSNLTGIVEPEAELLKNPYLIAERWIQPAVKTTVQTDEEGNEEEFVSIVPPPTFWTVDRAVYLPKALAAHHPLPGPEAAWEADDARRVRALLAHVLRTAERDGHTALPQPLLLERVAGLAIEPPVQVDADSLVALRAIWEAAEDDDEPDPELVFHPLGDGSHLVQTKRRDSITRSLRNLTRRVRKLKRLPVTADWNALLENILPASDGTPRELKAREEKAAALAELATARFSVLIGPAGTGKTSILRALLDEPGIRSGGVLLLAPTGKARVRMQTQTKHSARTLAQFLHRHQRYNGATGAYFINPEADPVSQFKTVIVDESSMLTEDQLAALLDATRGAERVILVGDPGQLPPIGAGRPFADLVEALRPVDACWPCVAPGYAELTQRMRQDQRDGVEPPDLQLAEFFSGRVADDEILHHLAASPGEARLRCVRWDDAEDFRTRFRQTLCEEFSLKNDDLEELCGALGASGGNGKWHFNRGAELRIEDWQILSPMNLAPGGTEELNRILHNAMRGGMVRYASGRQSAQFRVIKPLGAQQIVYGCKVINTVNRPHSFRYVWPRQLDDGTKPLLYLANGEIGVVTGRNLFAKDGKSPWFPKQVEVCFASQPGFAYSFLAGGFGDEGDAPLQLAYAISVHKSQGSEFRKTFVVLPKSAATLCRELLYTALTRHKDKVILLHEGDIRDIGHWSSHAASATARRFTTVNLDEPEPTRRPQPVRVKDRKTGRDGWYEQYLIHRTRRGDLVSSKAEVIVANELDYAREKNWLSYTYEEHLIMPGGDKRVPDFTLRDELGRTFYWEHCGMPDNPGYAEKWRNKLAWYAAHGITLWHAETNPDGRLIVTEDRGGRLDASRVKEIIAELFG
ncbi:MAG: AAA family ATPase [Opitutaceae bacterium]|nr:AAA family ATPase [Opitutaceae bacterium]